MVSPLGDSLIQSLLTLLSSPDWSPGHQLPWGTLWAPHTQQSLLLRPARCLLRARSRGLWGFGVPAASLLSGNRASTTECMKVLGPNTNPTTVQTWVREGTSNA